MNVKDLKGFIASDLIIVATETKGKMPSKLNFTELIDVVTDVVKNCSIYDVSQQRELLLAYHKHLDSFNDPTIYNASESMIDDYLANNCA